MSTGSFEMPKAPMDITPARFFGEWLPAQVEPFKPLIQAMAGDIAFTMAIKVTGDGGGEWTVKLAGGKLEVVPGLDPAALVTLALSEKNFVQAVTGQLDDLRMQPQGLPKGGLTPEIIKQQAQKNIEALTQIHGLMEFHAEDPQRPFMVGIKFAGPMKDQADCVIKMDQEDIRSMVKGETNPQAAFMSGKIRIEGDMGLLMQLAPLMM
ncbi:MAG TPA: SCP2 sterol-binding domain-containing protein [bacterium]|nr:SCP2 sterol-binding domain-containing protein [bacterium]